MGRMTKRVADCRWRTSRDLRSAREAIIDVAWKARDYSLELRQAIQSNSVQDEMLLSQGSRDLSEIMDDYFRRVGRITLAQERAARRATEGSAGILDLLQELRSVVRASKLVTLNAAVWAEHFEANGPLALLVENMSRLNRDVNTEASSIAQAAQELLALLPRLVDSISALRSLSQEFIFSSATHGGEVSRAMSDLRERAEDVSRRGNSRVVEIMRAAEEASRRLDCIAIFERCFQELRQVMAHIAENDGAGPSARGADPEDKP
jgi:hypothetical protein